MKKFSRQKDSSSFSSHNPFWIYGLHAVCAALDNPHRPCHRLLYLSEDIFKMIEERIRKRALVSYKVDKVEFQKLFGSNAVHQGIALEISPLNLVSLEDFLHHTSSEIILATLDQITDPHNIGAIARSAAAFKVQALIIPDRHAVSETSPILYKTASGALEHISLIRVTNLARTLRQLHQAGFWNIGLDAEGDKNLDDSILTGPLNLILGSEGKGLRRLTRDYCDSLVRLPTIDKFSTVNVSNAAAIAFYVAHCQRKGKEA
jgi:23S rRNA (guanosine2251-2'-O)-methyltransferase